MGSGASKSRKDVTARASNGAKGSAGVQYDGPPVAQPVAQPMAQPMAQPVPMAYGPLFHQGPMAPFPPPPVVVQRPPIVVQQPPVMVGRPTPPVDPEVLKLQAELAMLKERNRHAEELATIQREADAARIQAMEEQTRRERAAHDARVQAMQDAEAEAAAERRAITNQSVGIGATIGFFAAGPLGAGIGAYLGNKHAKARIAEER